MNQHLEHATPKDLEYVLMILIPTFGFFVPLEPLDASQETLSHPVVLLIKLAIDSLASARQLRLHLLVHHLRHATDKLMTRPNTHAPSMIKDNKFFAKLVIHLVDPLATNLPNTAVKMAN